jgi:hypothetical protein
MNKMSNRYIAALAFGRDAFEAAVREDHELLAQFGLELLSIEGGVRAAVKKELRNDRIDPWNVLTIEDKTWRWLRPLLIQLQEVSSEAD